MSLKCGIVGLPNVGKSTLFNALTKAGIAAENYPFCTIEPNVGVVEVPDPRLQQLAQIISPERIVPAIPLRCAPGWTGAICGLWRRLTRWPVWPATGANRCGTPALCSRHRPCCKACRCMSPDCCCQPLPKARRCCWTTPAPGLLYARTPCRCCVLRYQK